MKILWVSSVYFAEPLRVGVSSVMRDVLLAMESRFGQNWMLEHSGYYLDSGTLTEEMKVRDIPIYDLSLRAEMDDLSRNLIIGSSSLNELSSAQFDFAIIASRLGSTGSFYDYPCNLDPWITTNVKIPYVRLTMTPEAISPDAAGNGVIDSSKYFRRAEHLVEISKLAEIIFQYRQS